MCTYVYIIMLYVCFYVGEHLVQALPFVLPLHFVINLIIIIIIIIITLFSKLHSSTIFQGVHNEPMTTGAYFFPIHGTWSIYGLAWLDH